MVVKKRCPDFAEILRRTSADSQLRQQVASCFYEELRRMARMQCGDRTKAEDAAHDGLITTLESLDAFRGEAPIEAWLRRIVASACSRLNRGRKNDPTFNLPLEEEIEKGAQQVEDALQESAVLLKERIELLKEALAEVPEPNRSLFVLHEGRDHTIEELARRFELTEEGVKSRLKRTRAHLRQELLTLAEAIL
jgi:RNA polymerase sigma-70 factor, ECF subfamily